MWLIGPKPRAKNSEFFDFLHIYFSASIASDPVWPDVEIKVAQFFHKLLKM